MPWDDEFARLEKAIGQLTAGYDAFLYGTAGKPPVDIRRQVDATFRRLDAADPETAADGFRLSTLQTRYTALCERWDRLQAEKEAGKRPGVYARFTDYAIRPADAAGPSATDSTVPLNAPGSASVEPSGGMLPGRQPAAPAEKDLFERYVGAKRARGEDVSGYDLERFVETLERERQKIRERVGEVEIEFDVRERDGRVRLVARRKGAPTP
jgi:hypothetical protein